MILKLGSYHLLYARNKSLLHSLQAFSQMRLSEASAHLGMFSTSKEEASWISSTAVKAADAILSTCPSPYEKRCLLQLLASTDFADGGSAAACYRRLYWKINLAEPVLRKHEDLQLGNETLDDASLLSTLENNGYWEQARNWARQLEASGAPWKSAAHHVTERQVNFVSFFLLQIPWNLYIRFVSFCASTDCLMLQHIFFYAWFALIFLNTVTTKLYVVETDFETDTTSISNLRWILKFCL